MPEIFHMYVKGLNAWFKWCKPMAGNTTRFSVLLKSLKNTRQKITLRFWRYPLNLSQNHCNSKSENIQVIHSCCIQRTAKLNFRTRTNQIWEYEELLSNNQSGQKIRIHGDAEAYSTWATNWSAGVSFHYPRCLPVWTIASDQCKNLSSTARKLWGQAEILFVLPPDR